MFELATQKAGTVLETTRMLARDVYRNVKREKHHHYAKHANEETAEAKKGVETGMVDEVDAHVLKSLKNIERGEHIDIKIERKIMMFMYRVLKEYLDEEDQFTKVERTLEQVFAGNTPEDQESKKYLAAIIKFFQQEQARIHDELLRFARIMKDQDFQNLRMRDEIIAGVMKDMQDRMKARRLRRDWSKEHREEKAIVRDLHTIYQSLHKQAEKKKIEAALKNLGEHLKKENNVLEHITDNIEFILKMAVMLVFKIMKAENQEEMLINHLKELKYPDSHWEILNKKKEGVEKSIVDDLGRVMHEMYQLLHSDEGAKKAA